MAATVALYAIIFLTVYDVLNYSIMIPSMGLIALCAWLYGFRIGILSILPWMLLNTCLAIIVSAPPDERTQALNPVGILTALIVAVVLGTLKESYRKLSNLKSSLSARIDAATNELETLVGRLIDQDEEERFRIGQDLHDGIGQHLTGMLLLCEALSLSFTDSHKKEATLTAEMRSHIEHCIHTFRKFARSLLPIPFQETTLENALSEMTSYFREYFKVKIHLDCRGNSKIIPTHIIQHLYRIIHELLHRIICKLDAEDVNISLIIDEQYCRCTIIGTLSGEHKNIDDSIVSEIMKYRIGSIGGQYSFSMISNGTYQLEFMTEFREYIF